QMLGLKISFEIRLPPPGIGRRSLPSVQPLIKPEMHSPRKPKPGCCLGCSKENHENERDRRYCIRNLNLLSDCNDVQHHVHTKEDEHLSEIRKSEEGKHGHHGNHEKRQKVSSSGQPPSSSPKMSIGISKHPTKSQKEKNLHTLPWRCLT